MIFLQRTKGDFYIIAAATSNTRKTEVLNVHRDSETGRILVNESIHGGDRECREMVIRQTANIDLLIGYSDWHWAALESDMATVQISAGIIQIDANVPTQFFADKYISCVDAELAVAMQADKDRTIDRLRAWRWIT